MATKYLISGNWSADASWSTTGPTGPANTTKPTASDDVIFDALSGACTIDAASACRSLSLKGTAGITPYTNTLSHGNFTLTIGTSTSPPGGVALSWPTSGWTYTVTNAGARFLFSNTVNNTTQTVDFGGYTISKVAFNASNTGGIIQLTGNGFTASQGATPTIAVSRGSFDSNGLTFGGLDFQMTGGTGTVTLGASTVNLTNAGAAWVNTQGLTVSAGTSVINLSGANASFTGAAKTYATVNFTGTGTPRILDSGNTFGTLTRTGTAVKTDGFAVMSFTATTFTMTSDSILNRLYLTSTQWGVASTLTVGTYTGNNVDFSDITAAGAGSPFTGTSLGDGLGNSNITFTAAVTRYGVVAGNWDSTATWSATDGGAGGASVPLCHDPVVLNGNSGAGTYMINVNRAGASLDCTGFTRTLDSNTAYSFYGDYKLVNGMTATGVTDLTVLRGRGTHIVDCANKVLGGLRLDAFGGTYTLQNDWITPTRTFTLLAGTFNANNKNITMTNAALNTTGNMPAANTSVLNMGNGTWSMPQSSGAFWQAIAGTLTINAQGSTILHDTNNSSNRSFQGGGFTYNNMTFTGGGTGIVTFTGSNTFNVLTLGNATGNVMFFAFTSGTTQTVSSLVATGTATKLITITAVTPGSAATISKASGTVSADYLSLTDSAASGGAAFYAGANSTNVSGNTGWIFTAPPAASGRLALLGVG